MELSRRSLFRLSAAAFVPTPEPTPQPTFKVDEAKLQSIYDAARTQIVRNIITLPYYGEPVLVEGGPYPGIWLECAPQEGQVYTPWNARVAKENHRAFYVLQRADGQMPCPIRKERLGYAQIQMVVPIAATALEVANATLDDKFLNESYTACAKWDAWLAKYRNTRGTGLCELFCEYDTGHDRSPRIKGVPHQCPGGEARNVPDVAELPWLAPDLSATVYGGRVALARMARQLGKMSDEAAWLESAERLRKLIIEKLYDANDASFYDLTKTNRFVRVRGDLMTRICGEHVVDSAMFEEMWRRQLGNPKAFWTPYPLPSIAIDDATFVRPIPQNSWGGAAQALTALRAPRWMEHYGRYVELAHLMRQWIAALTRAGEFLQQLDPLTGEMTPHVGGYSPAILCLLDFTARLYGVQRSPSALEWNCRLAPGAKRNEATLPTAKGTAQLVTTAQGSTLTLSGKQVAKVTGTARVLTNDDGELRGVVGTEATPQTVTIATEDTRAWKRTVQPNEVVIMMGSAAPKLMRE